MFRNDDTGLHFDMPLDIRGASNAVYAIIKYDKSKKSLEAPWTEIQKFGDNARALYCTMRIMEDEHFKFSDEEMTGILLNERARVIKGVIYAVSRNEGSRLLSPESRRQVIDILKTFPDKQFLRLWRLVGQYGHIRLVELVPDTFLPAVLALAQIESKSRIQDYYMQRILAVIQKRLSKS